MDDELQKQIKQAIQQFSVREFKRLHHEDYPNLPKETYDEVIRNIIFERQMFHKLGSKVINYPYHKAVTGLDLDKVIV